MQRHRCLTLSKYKSFLLILKPSMKFPLSFVALTSAVSGFGVGNLGERVITNLNLTPSCAQTCIFNPKWTRTYAPECANIPIGIEYGTKLCQNYMYQHMLDNCFKEKCNDQDRKKVSPLNTLLSCPGTRSRQRHLCELWCLS